MYTPQVTINGYPGFVGSRQNQACQEINCSLRQHARASLDLRVSTSNDQVTITYQVSGDYRGKDLQIALVEVPPTC